jgi:hypothetical protein
MGEAEIFIEKHEIIIHSIFIIYGDAANEALAHQIATDTASAWNSPAAKVYIDKVAYRVKFQIQAIYNPHLTELEVISNTDPRVNFFRVEEYADGNISYVDAINSNTGYFMLANLIHPSTTAAHEYGHTIGLHHPDELDIRGHGTPGIMYPRGTLVDPHFQYDPNVISGAKGGTLNPVNRKVTQHDIDLLNIPDLEFNKRGMGVIGDFTSIWHDKQMPI